MAGYSLPFDPAVTDVNVSFDADIIVKNDVFTSNIVPSRYSQFSVEPYFVLNGLPFGEGNYGLAVQTECIVTTASSPVPDTPQTIDLSFASHWLPDSSYYNSTTGVWSGYNGSNLMNLTKGISPTSPRIITSFSYLSKRSYVSSSVMHVDGGAYFSTSNLSWSQTQSIAAVFVPRIPAGEEFVILETNLSTDTYGSDVFGDFISVRYDKSGRVVFLAGDDILWRSNTVYGYLSRPLIVAVSINSNDRSVRLIVVDNSKTVATTFTVNHPYTGQMYIGYSPSAVASHASMDILDVSMWASNISSNTFDNYVQKLNQLYGVSL